MSEREPILEFWFEFASTYSYVAAARVEPLAAVAGVRVAWRPFLLGPIFRAQGWNDSPFNIYPAKGRYMWRDMERLCAAAGIAFKRPSRFPRGSVLAARIALVGAEEPWGAEFVRRVYRASFAEDLEIGEPAVIVEILGGLGLPAADLCARAELPDAKARLREQTDKAIDRGVFGAPTFFVGREMFWGSDRLEQAVAWASTGHGV
jgi:2-hydroxychromene-2-carboxylate isomerase